MAVNKKYLTLDDYLMFINDVYAMVIYNNTDTNKTEYRPELYDVAMQIAYRKYFLSDSQEDKELYDRYINDLNENYIHRYTYDSEQIDSLKIAIDKKIDFAVQQILKSEGNSLDDLIYSVISYIDSMKDKLSDIDEDTIKKITNISDKLQYVKNPFTEILKENGE